MEGKGPKSKEQGPCVNYSKFDIFARMYMVSGMINFLQVIFPQQASITENQAQKSTSPQFRDRQRAVELGILWIAII